MWPLQLQPPSPASWHSGLVVSTSSLQHWGPRFKSLPGYYLHAVSMFSMCLYGFPPFSSHAPQAYARLIGSCVKLMNYFKSGNSVSRLQLCSVAEVCKISRLDVQNCTAFGSKNKTRVSNVHLAVRLGVLIFKIRFHCVLMHCKASMGDWSQKVRQLAFSRDPAMAAPYFCPSGFTSSLRLRAHWTLK